MVKLIATKPHTYNNKVIQTDEEFEADEPFATTLVTLARARRADENGKKKASKAKPMTSADESGDDKKYQTRQVKAEDE